MKKYHVVLTFIIIETALIALFVLTTYAFKIYYYYKEKREAEMTQKVREALDRIVSIKHIQPIPFVDRIDPVIRTLEIYEETHKDDDDWEKNKEIIVKEQLLPIARRFIDRRS